MAAQNKRKTTVKTSTNKSPDARPVKKPQIKAETKPTQKKKNDNTKLLIIAAVAIILIGIFWLGPRLINNGEDKEIYNDLKHPAPTPVQRVDYTTLELSQNFRNLTDGLNMTPRGVIWARFINMKLASGTPLEEYASEMVQPAGFYEVPLAAMYAADYSSSSWIELHDIGHTNQAIQPVISDGMSNVIATRPFIYGHTNNVEKTRQLMADPSSMDSAYLDFQIVLEEIDVNNTIISDVSNSLNQYADIFYSGLSDEGNGLVKREMVYHLNLGGGASLRSQFEARAANSLANGFTSYNVTQDNNILKVTVIGTLDNVLNEAI
ncbi:MAG TPA: hypothetical protein VMW53_03065 [archaeon]|nr:hypothetical protein [archaeon]